MSVPKWRRSESRLDAFYEAVKLRYLYSNTDSDVFLQVKGKF